jgi:hypothetical protein
LFLKFFLNYCKLFYFLIWNLFNSILHSEFTEYQIHRQKFIPKVPETIANVGTCKVSLHEESYKMIDGLEKLFPTLMDPKKGGMKYIELKVDPKGQVLKA